MKQHKTAKEAMQQKEKRCVMLVMKMDYILKEQGHMKQKAGLKIKKFYI